VTHHRSWKRPGQCRGERPLRGELASFTDEYPVSAWRGLGSGDYSRRAILRLMSVFPRNVAVPSPFIWQPGIRLKRSSNDDQDIPAAVHKRSSAFPCNRRIGPERTVLAQVAARQPQRKWHRLPAPTCPPRGRHPVHPMGRWSAAGRQSTLLAAQTVRKPKTSAAVRKGE
jgi:hypothetical protein